MQQIAACAVEAREPSSTTSTVFLNWTFGDAGVAHKGPLQGLARDATSASSGCAADAHGVSPLTSQPRFSNSTRARWKIVGQAGTTISADETRDQVKTLVASIRNGSNDEAGEP